MLSIGRGKETIGEEAERLHIGDGDHRPKQITIIKLTNLFNDEAEWGLPVIKSIHTIALSASSAKRVIGGCRLRLVTALELIELLEKLKPECARTPIFKLT